MRTEYRLWVKNYVERQASSYRELGLHPTPAAAASATDVPDLSRWPDGLSGSGERSAGPWLITPERVPESIEDRAELAVDVALRYALYDGDHHKMWVIDQMVRHLTGDRYPATVGDDWDEGVAP